MIYKILTGYSHLYLERSFVDIGHNRTAMYYRSSTFADTPPCIVLFEMFGNRGGETCVLVAKDRCSCIDRVALMNLSISCVCDHNIANMLTINFDNRSEKQTGCRDMEQQGNVQQKPGCQT